MFEKYFWVGGSKACITWFCAALFCTCSILAIIRPVVADNIIVVDGKSYKKEYLQTKSPNIADVGHMLIDGIYAEMGFFTYPENNGAQSDSRFTGLVVGPGVRWLETEPSGQSGCWEAIRFRLFSVEPVGETTYDTNLLEFNLEDCPQAVSLPERIILRRNYNFFYENSDNVNNEENEFLDLYYDVFTSENRDFPIDLFFDNSGANISSQPRIVFDGAKELNAAVLDQEVDESYAPFVPDQACAHIPVQHVESFRQALRQIPEVWWYNNAFNLRDGRLASEAYFDEELPLQIVREKFFKGTVARPMSALYVTNPCLYGLDDDLDESLELFQIQSYPLAFNTMLKKVEQIGIGFVAPMRFGTAGGTPRDFFTVGSSHIKTPQGELDANLLERALRKGLELALKDASRAEILADHPFGVPFAYNYEVSGFGSALTGDASRWEVFRVESSVAMHPNISPDRDSNVIELLVLSVGLPITKVRTRRENDPPPLNLTDGFEEETDGPAFRRFLMRYKSHICVITRCGLSSAENDDINHEWIKQ